MCDCLGAFVYCAETWLYWLFIIVGVSLVVLVAAVRRYCCCGKCVYYIFLHTSYTIFTERWNIQKQYLFVFCRTWKQKFEFFVEQLAHLANCVFEVRARNQQINNRTVNVQSETRSTTERRKIWVFFRFNQFFSVISQLFLFVFSRVEFNYEFFFSHLFAFDFEKRCDGKIFLTIREIKFEKKNEWTKSGKKKKIDWKSENGSRMNALKWFNVYASEQ